MRTKITRDARTALLNRRSFRRGRSDVAMYNTEVYEDGTDWVLALHGNPIVKLHTDNSLSVCDGGHNGYVTRERLNAFCSVHQSKWVLYLEGTVWDHSSEWIHLDKVEQAQEARDISGQLEFLRALDSGDTDNKTVATWAVNHWDRKSDHDVSVLRAYASDHFNVN